MDIVGHRVRLPGHDWGAPEAVVSRRGHGSFPEITAIIMAGAWFTRGAFWVSVVVLVVGLSVLVWRRFR